MVAQVDRLPLEDDEVFVSDLKLFSGGAAANTAYACGKFGLKTVFVGKLGKNDAFGLKIINDFNDVNVITSLIRYSNEYCTGSAYIVLNKEGDRRIYAHSGAANHLSKNDIVEQELGSTKIIFLSSLKNIEPLIKAAEVGQKYKIPIILNPGMLIIDQGFSKIKELLKKIDILILSKREFQSLFKFEDKDNMDDLIKEKTNHLLNLGLKTLIITMGKDGATVLNFECSELIKPISDNLLRVTDTTGAGDAFSAGFIYAFIKNISYDFEDLKNSVKIGNFVAGRCIQKLGARNGLPNGEELISEFFK
ncbi:hypothetical protein LCGC14_0948180 [marine sediment metagenome]|uniref:Carbohydrate kinase PfkB domain-containing protein n=1 Tax=marine sediment metagenome TaxID=412755 RepID=A0A0F9RPH4_9ZZZZ